MDRIDIEIIFGLIGLGIIFIIGYGLGYALGLEVFIK
jgi:hypothetical protein